MGTAEDFVPLPILQDHFEAAPVLHVRRSHALNVLSCRRHGSGHQVSLCQRVPVIATGGDDVVDEEQGSCPAKFYRRTCNGAVKTVRSRIDNPARSSHTIAGSPACPEAKDHLHPLNFVALSEQRSKFAAGRTSDRDGSVVFQLTDI